MLNFGSPIKHKVKFRRNDGTEASCVLTCINENDAVSILKAQSLVEFKELIECKKLDDCDDCKL